MNPTSIHSAYFNVRFRGPWPDRDHPGEFAIITAYATTGETWSDERNRAADIELERELRATGSWMRRLAGYDPATGHAEPGWAVGIGLDVAHDLGLRFHQDAIFWISEDDVWVETCGHDRERAKIGFFSERLDVEAEPPGVRHHPA